MWDLAFCGICNNIMLAIAAIDLSIKTIFMSMNLLYVLIFHFRDRIC